MVFAPSLDSPIAVRDEVLGVLIFHTTWPYAYSPDELAYLTSFADQAAIAIQHAQLYEALEARARRFDTMTRPQPTHLRLARYGRRTA